MYSYSTYFLKLFLICFIFCFLSEISFAVNVKDFGAKGDGETDDTDAIKAAILGATDGLVEFPRGNYRITKTIDVDLSKHGTLGISGNGASATITMAGDGPAFRFIGSHDKGSAQPSSVKPVTWEKERMPLIDALEIIGAHSNADGIELKNTLMPTLRALLIRNVRNGIHLTSRNRNVLIDGCHFYNNSGIGIFLDNVNIHQFIISDSHISNQELNIHLEHTRGISINGNTFIRGYNRHLLINNSSNLIINGNVFDHNKDYFPSQPFAYGGILLSNGENVILSDNILDGSGNGNQEDGGAIVIKNSREVSIITCHIKNPIFTGIQILNTINLHIVNCMITENAESNGMATGIMLKGVCTNTLLKDNSIMKGKVSEISDSATGVILKDNISIKAINKP